MNSNGKETGYSLVVYHEKDQYSVFYQAGFDQNGRVITRILQVNNFGYQKLAACDIKTGLTAT